MSIARTLGDPWLLAEALNDLSSVCGGQAYSPHSVSLIEESLRLRRTISFVPGIADSLNNLGWQALLAEDYPAAVVYLEESLELARELSQRMHVVMAQDNLALAHLFNGEPERAERLLRENIRRCWDMGDRRIGSEALFGLAGTAAQMREWDRAAWLSGAASALMAEIKLPPSDVDSRIHERFLSDGRRALGDQRHDRRSNETSELRSKTPWHTHWVRSPRADRSGVRSQR